MKLVFAGTPEFAAVALRALLGAGFDIPLVLTQPDRPAGRGLKLQPSAVKSCAVEAGIEVAQPRGLRLDGRWAEDAQAAREALLQAQPDVMVVAAYGLILPRWALDLPRRGCVNIHASLLPRWRGAAPIHRAIEAGDTLTGITIMQMDEGLDTGDILMMRSMAIEPHDTTASLHDRLAVLGGELVVQSLRALEEGSLEARPQPAEGVTYARKIEKAEALLDWSLPASVLSCRIRAFDPFPGLVFSDGRDPIKLWAARVADGGSPALDTHRPGEILAIGPQGVQVRCAQAEILELQTLQRPGGRRLPAVAVAQALGWQVGQRLDAPVADR